MHKKFVKCFYFERTVTYILLSFFLVSRSDYFDRNLTGTYKTVSYLWQTGVEER